MIKVLIVDDHPIFRAGAQTFLAAEPDFKVVGEAGTAMDALARIPHLAQTSDAVNRQLSCFSSR